LDWRIAEMATLAKLVTLLVIELMSSFAIHLIDAYNNSAYASEHSQSGVLPEKHQVIFYPP
jgi:hypothetical protein